MKVTYKKIIASIGVMLLSATAAEATPAFAKQVDMDCIACHYQNIPKLNSFGRDFKLSGFTMTSTKEIKSDQSGGLSLPSTLNMGFITKARLHKTMKFPMKTEIFDEAAFIFGGKVAEGVGTSMEFSNGGLLGAKFAFTKESSVGRLGFTYFMTDALGAFSGTEVYSTGLYRPVRQFENRKKANIFQKLDIGAGEATGFQAYYSGNGLYATVGQYAPIFGNSAETGSDFKTIIRAAYEMNLGTYTVAVGGYSLSGDVTESPYGLSGNFVEKYMDLASNGIDFQIEGDIGGSTLMVTGGYVISNTYTEATVEHDVTGMSIGAQINPIDVLGLKAAYLSTTDNINNSDSGETTITIGSDYMYAQNVRLCLEVSSTSFELDAKDDQTDILFMSMIAF